MRQKLLHCLEIVVVSEKQSIRINRNSLRRFDLVFEVDSFTPRKSAILNLVALVSRNAIKNQFFDYFSVTRK